MFVMDEDKVERKDEVELQFLQLNTTSQVSKRLRPHHWPRFKFHSTLTFVVDRFDCLYDLQLKKEKGKEPEEHTDAVCRILGIIGQEPCVSNSGGALY
jgi:hypothetical protein